MNPKEYKDIEIDLNECIEGVNFVHDKIVGENCLKFIKKCAKGDF